VSGQEKARKKGDLKNKVGEKGKRRFVLFLMRNLSLRRLITYLQATELIIPGTPVKNSIKGIISNGDYINVCEKSK
jgi:hypothetical protein